MKLWNRADEWTDLALCGGDIRFIKPPNELGPREVKNIQSICAKCPVRPECIQLNTSPVTDLALKVRRPASSIWVAGVWLPEVNSEDRATRRAQRKELQGTQAALLASLPQEYDNRPDEVR